MLPLLELVALVAVSAPPARPDPSPRFARADGPIHVAELRGIVHPLSAEYVVEAIDRADLDRAALFVLEIDTPGGLVDSMKEIVQRMLRARTPIVVFVAPSGARAASAGFMLLLGADVAAMAPGTNTGAAHPVDLGAGAEPDEVSAKKAESDLAAFARTIAQNRRRNVEWAEKAVTESASFTEIEAQERGLIDLVARDRADLLDQLHGRTVRRFDGTECGLSTRGEIVAPLEGSFAQRVLGPLLRPELVLLLLGVGVLGLYVELSHPGLVFPGVVGVLCLLLFALAFRILPINTVGLLLVALGLVLFLLEIKIASYGLLTVGGFACLIAGLMLVFPRDVPALRVPLGFVLPLALALGALMTTVAWLVARAQRAPVATGTQGMIGEVGRAITDLAPRGKVQVHGETWNASAISGLASGVEVRVVGIDGLELVVEKKES
jgi:membrane-bound serine protease (ClpP class)